MEKHTSNGGYRREEKSGKHWSLFTKHLSSVAWFFSYSKKSSKQKYVCSGGANVEYLCKCAYTKPQLNFSGQNHLPTC